MAFKIPTSGKSQIPLSTTTRAEQYTPISVSENELNRLAPAGSVVAKSPKLVPSERTLDSTGQSVIRPTPVGKP